MKTCITCGMPLEGEHTNDVGMELPEGLVCKYDCENGQIKAPEIIFQGGVEFFASSCTDGNRALAEKLTRKNMNTLPYWKAHHFALLDGEQATDQEMAAAVAKI